jgi:hypothetical protein
VDPLRPSGRLLDKLGKQGRHALRRSGQGGARAQGGTEAVVGPVSLGRSRVFGFPGLNSFILGELQSLCGVDHNSGKQLNWMSRVYGQRETIKFTRNLPESAIA